MDYEYTDVDNINRGWFEHDKNISRLRSIDIEVGEIRGLARLRVEFRHPITAIAGRNGSGKTTVLALAACAYHNKHGGYHPPNRKQSYYTFSDFFIQAANEIPLEGISLMYSYAGQAYRINYLTGEVASYSNYRMAKYQGGRWNSYSGRPGRTVVFLGVERVVPHSEKSVSKSHRRSFKQSDRKGWEHRVKEIAGRILNKTYTEFEYRRHAKYSLPIVTQRGRSYSGFNMGVTHALRAPPRMKMGSTLKAGVVCSRGRFLLGATNPYGSMTRMPAGTTVCRWAVRPKHVEETL